MDNLQTFYGPNAGYVLDLYERYRTDPSAVDEKTRAIFARWRPVVLAEGEALAPGRAEGAPFAVEKVVAAVALAHAIRERGHLAAQLDPLGRPPQGDPALLPESHGLTEEDLVQLPASVVGGHAAEGARNALEAMQRLRAMYSGTISYEFDQVKSPQERLWLRDAVGLQLFQRRLSPQSSRQLLQRLTQVEVFERFLHQTYPGQKRFSIEGCDVLVPMLDELIRCALESETREVIIGMAHRGRLNVLAHVLGKSYQAILAEFAHTRHEEGVPLTDTFGFGWSGDVKYHLGAEHLLGGERSLALKVILAPNPSHLEFVNPVVEGMTRAAQERRDRAGAPRQELDETLPILIHGDAAFPGEGVVAETLNLWHLQGYSVGGTIHIILNNQLGFTTEPQESRSTLFASDLAKGFSIPIIHVNADDPEAALTAIRLAHAYRDEFHKDILIELVGYRRWGHNEGDEPAFTQPQLYELIRAHPTVRELYARHLQEQGLVTSQECEQMVEEAFATLRRAKQEVDEDPQRFEQLGGNGQNGLAVELEPAPPVSAEQLRQFNRELLRWPQGFTVHQRLARVLQRRADALEQGSIDWGHAEALAFASILADGIPIRLSGQDSERGTFSQRHAVLHDSHTGERYVPLQHLSQAQASFAIYNSPLTETAVLGFEYGYSVHAPEALVLWEAQYGDFANVAQVIIDQFIAAGRAKWRQNSSVVLLLPHGYEGQGPDHSSARLERFLQLSAGHNWRVTNCSTAAQYYHLLRQQAHSLQRHPLPLVVLTPKSLLRHPLAAARLEELTSGRFQPVLDDAEAQQRAQTIRRVLLCSGKMAIDLLASEQRSRASEVAVVRVEQLYPLPEEELLQVLSCYPSMQELVWVQEEPLNMGAWSYMAPRLQRLLASLSTPQAVLRVLARPESASPATGFMDRYEAEQRALIEGALLGEGGLLVEKRAAETPAGKRRR
ncbi:MAG: 2-oxoglutarate dehydrogenase E1 component [Thermogemmatispora sp.]|jgi:2-oxoglutarate dehydrogenase E1 component|uniref:oxoglutarate dehydrogenase (succinyl-transferring) n=1 Tax=Thermogemmatispora aurantia TaxID=2045279 RepID=A0A5J4KA54_9CHLR|nr:MULTISPECIES: 2-oxoglutarate dehydrogenase E1 component [Thermogemmatispora]MBE3564120.1 2-oxoglutarate dehydrogenase E1 component [Thermogemmatispora sp.]GER83550.1 2-oxoglutarate dehydrogenase E1 component [Thermogemmatispora aurantia]